MRACLPLVLSIAYVSACLGGAVQAQQTPPDAPSAQTQENSHVVEGTVVSMSRQILVVRSDDNQYHLFTYAAGTVPEATVKPGARVRVSAAAPDENGTQLIENITVIHPSGEAAHTEPGSRGRAAPSGE